MKYEYFIKNARTYLNLDGPYPSRKAAETGCLKFNEQGIATTIVRYGTKEKRT